MPDSLSHVTGFSGLWRAIVGGLILSVSLAFLLATASPSYALGIPDVSITAITPIAALDSNNACATGPRGMFIQVNVKNTKASALSAVSAKLGSFSNPQFL